MFKLDLEKAELTFTVSLKKKKNSRNTPISVSLTMLKPLAVWITTNSGKFFEMVKTEHLTCLLRNL